MLIRSNPPGAMAYVDDRPIGLTPIATDFTYYGNRRVRLVKDGYETLTVAQPVPTPWYEIPPLDFFSENVVPGQIRDHRIFDYQLRPQALVPTEQTLQHAEDLRRQTHAAVGTQPSLLLPATPDPAIPGPTLTPDSTSPAAPYTPPSGWTAPGSGF